MSTARGRVGRIAVVTVLFALLPLVATTSYRLRVLSLVITFALFAVSLNVVFGHTDQLFLFVGGLGGVSGYATVSIAGALGVTPWLTLPLGVALAGLVGVTVSYVAAKRRFSVILIAIFTLSLQLALSQFFVGASDVTGGNDGLVVRGLGVSNRLVFYYLFLVVLVAFLIGYDRLVHSRYGLAFATIREDELAAAASGVDVVRYKAAAGLLGALMIGLVGALHGFSEGRLFPATYAFTSIDVLVLIMLVLGGLRTLLGPIVGAALIYLVYEGLAGTSGWRTFVFGVLLIVLFLYFRRGIVPSVSSILTERGFDLDAVVGDAR